MISAKDLDNAAAAAAAALDECIDCQRRVAEALSKATELYAQWAIEQSADWTSEQRAAMQRFLGP